MLSEMKKIVPVMIQPANFADVDCDSIDMSGFHKATFIFNFGTCGSAVTVKPESGASAGTSTTAVPSIYALGGAAIGTAVATSTSAASCDVLGAWATTATTVVSTATTKMLIIEIDAANMTDGEDWLTLNVGGTDLIASAVAILEPRYTGNRSETCLV